VGSDWQSRFLVEGRGGGVKYTIELIDNQRRRSFLTTPLKPGEIGNEQSCRLMGFFVRRDAQSPTLRKWVLETLIKSAPGHDARAEIAACFQFAQNGIVYRHDPLGIERVADLQSILTTLAPNGRPEGDCGIKSVALATSLALLGYKPAFVLAAKSPYAKGFSHIYCQTTLDGRRIPLDPTPVDKPLGWEIPAGRRRIYEIF